MQPAAGRRAQGAAAAAGPAPAPATADAEPALDGGGADDDAPPASINLDVAAFRMVKRAHDLFVLDNGGVLLPTEIPDVYVVAPLWLPWQQR